VRFWGLKKADVQEGSLGSTKSLWGTKKSKGGAGALARPFWGDKARDAPPAKDRRAERERERERERPEAGAPERGERHAEPEGAHAAPVAQARPEEAPREALAGLGTKQGGIPGTWQERVHTREPSASGRSHKQLVVIVVVVAVVMGMVSCAVGFQMRTRPRGQVAGDTESSRMTSGSYRL